MSAGRGPMDMNEHERLAAEHVVGLLEGEERARAERLEASDPAFQAAVARWQARLVELDDTASAEPASEALWRRIEAGLGTAKEPLRVDSAVPVIVPSPHTAFMALWRSLAFWRVAGLAGAFASVVLALGVGLLANRAAREPVLIAVLLTDQNRPAAVVNAFANGSAELIPLESIPVPPGRALEIWTIPEANGRPISVGVLDTVRSMQLNLGQAPGLRQSHVLAISIEPSGGSPTGQPTGPVIMKGTAAAAL